MFLQANFPLPFTAKCPYIPARMHLGENGKTTSLVAVAKIILLLYLFLLSISLLGCAFKCFGQDFAHQLISATSNPFLGLVIGVIVTSLVQSSSVTTSLIVGLVGGGALSLNSAIPMVMGANIGTTVTNTLVSLGQITHKQDFKRAYSAAVVHDSFNFIAVAIFLPFQIKFNILGKLATSLGGVIADLGGAKFSSPVKAAVSPVAKIVVEAAGSNPWILIAISAVLVFLSLNFLVKTLKSVVMSKVQVFFDRVIFKNSLISLLFGLLVTVLVQSSSITTSLIVPLAGAGLLNLYQVFPYTLGANVGTTVTAMLASLATGEMAAVSVALAHLLFNVMGIVVIWPIRSVPVKMAEFMAKLAVKNRLFPVAIIVLLFYAIPLAVLFLMR